MNLLHHCNYVQINITQYLTTDFDQIKHITVST